MIIVDSKAFLNNLFIIRASHFKSLRDSHGVLGSGMVLGLAFGVLLDSVLRPVTNTEGFSEKESWQG